MKVAYKSSFDRDIKKIIDKNVIETIKIAIKNVEDANNIKGIDSLKKLTGYKTYYRISKDVYRFGLNIENEIVTFVRFLHRKEIYKKFP